MSQTLWSFQAFSQLNEANSQAAAAEAAFRSAQQNLLLRVAQAYFAILSAADQLATNRAERDAFGTLLNQAGTRQQTGVGPLDDAKSVASSHRHCCHFIRPSAAAPVWDWPWRGRSLKAMAGASSSPIAKAGGGVSVILDLPGAPH